MQKILDFENWKELGENTLSFKNQQSRNVEIKFNCASKIEVWAKSSKREKKVFLTTGEGLLHFKISASPMLELIIEKPKSAIVFYQTPEAPEPVPKRDVDVYTELAQFPQIDPQIAYIMQQQRAQGEFIAKLVRENQHLTREAKQAHARERRQAERQAKREAERENGQESETEKTTEKPDKKGKDAAE